ncbi:hypothetical protein BDAP_002576 [Binucleata daphniae]
MTVTKHTVFKQYINNETEQTWQKIDELIQSLDPQQDITNYEQLLIQSILSDRSKLSGTALNFLKTAAININKVCQSEPNVSFINYIHPLFKLVGRSKKVFSLRGEETLVEVIKNIARPLVFLKENCNSLNKNVRLVSYKLLYEYYTRTCDAECLPLFENGYKDANLEVRMVCKQISKGNESFIASIPRRAKEVLASLKSYSPFKKHVKLNDETKIKINPEEVKIKEEVKAKKEIKESKTEEEIKRAEPIEQLKILTETPKKKDLAVTLTPRKLQEYIDKYNNEYEIERKYLIKFEDEEETVKIIKGLCSDIKNEDEQVSNKQESNKQESNKQGNNVEILGDNEKNNELTIKEDDAKDENVDKQETKDNDECEIVNDIGNNKGNDIGKDKEITCSETLNENNDLQISKDNSLIVKDEIDDIFEVVKSKKVENMNESFDKKGCTSKSDNTEKYTKRSDSEAYTSLKLTEMEEYLKTSNENNKIKHKCEDDEIGCVVTDKKIEINELPENSLLKNIEYCEETKIFDFSETDKSKSKIIHDMPNLKEKRISASFSKLSINDGSVVTIEDSLKNMSVIEDEEMKQNMNASEFTAVQSDVYVHKKDVVNKQEEGKNENL